MLPGIGGPVVVAALLSLADLLAFDPTHKPRDAGETRCCCPLCGGDKKIDARHRSLSYRRQTGQFHCHRCDAAGLLTDFHEDKPMQTYGGYTSRRDRSRHDLAARFRGPSVAAPPSPPAATDKDREVWASMMKTLQALAGTPSADYLESRGLPVAFCQAAGARHSRWWAGFPSAVFPLRDADGVLLAAQGRAIVETGNEPNKKTKNAPGCSMGVFATPCAWDAAALTLTEAPIDALSLALAGVPALAICGRELGGVRSTWLLPLFYGRHVLLAFDADETGDLISVKIAAELRAVGALSVRRLRPAGAKDWNALLLQLGAEAMRAHLAALLTDQEAAAAAEEAELLALGAEWEAELQAQAAAEAAAPVDLFDDTEDEEEEYL